MKANGFALILPLNMSNAETDFRRWFVDSLAPLRNNGDAGFIFVMVAFPLLERYLRNKSGTAEGESLGTDFFDLLGEFCLRL